MSAPDPVLVQAVDDARYLLRRLATAAEHVVSLARELPRTDGMKARRDAERLHHAATLTDEVIGEVWEALDEIGAKVDRERPAVRP